jgi:hypothetical protein
MYVYGKVRSAVAEVGVVGRWDGCCAVGRMLCGGTDRALVRRLVRDGLAYELHHATVGAARHHPRFGRAHSSEEAVLDGQTLCAASRTELVRGKLVRGKSAWSTSHGAGGAGAAGMPRGSGAPWSVRAGMETAAPVTEMMMSGQRSPHVDVSSAATSDTSDFSPNATHLATRCPLGPVRGNLSEPHAARSVWSADEEMRAGRRRQLAVERRAHRVLLLPFSVVLVFAEAQCTRNRVARPVVHRCPAGATHEGDENSRRTIEFSFRAIARWRLLRRHQQRC